MERKVQNVTFNALVYNIRAMLYDTYYTLDHIKIDIIYYNDTIEEIDNLMMNFDHFYIITITKIRHNYVHFIDNIC